MSKVKAKVLTVKEKEDLHGSIESSLQDLLDYVADCKYGMTYLDIPARKQQVVARLVKEGLQYVIETA